MAERNPQAALAKYNGAHTCRACGTALTKRPGVGRWPTYCPTPCRSGVHLSDDVRHEPGKGPSLWFLARTFLLEQTSARGWRPATATNYRYVLYDFMAHVGPERPASTLAKKHVEEWLASYSPTRSPGTVRYGIACISGFSAWMVENRYLRRDPTYGVQRPRRGRRIPRALDLDAIGATIRACHDVRAQLMAMWMCQEGLRCFEVAGIQMGDISKVDRSVRVVGKRDRERILPISDETWNTMVRYLEEYPTASGPLIRSYVQPSRGVQPHYVGKIVGEAMKAAGVKMAPRDGRSAHALRHSCATDMLKGGAHILDVRTALGHAYVSTTEIYLPLVVNDLRSAMAGRSYRP
ncbi:MAG TPA: tyrosine-type recombinase/integrase [Acidimicrobiales bacterium]|nr:tyrosine-type recombinase/integrase [Acidimicrobiales bacterium]